MKKNKNDLSSINVMEGINFKSNQKKVRQEEKKRERKERIENVLLIIAFGLLLMVVVFLLNKQTAEAKENCLSKGHSENYCERRV